MRNKYFSITAGFALMALGLYAQTGTGVGAGGGVGAGRGGTYTTTNNGTVVTQFLVTQQADELGTVIFAGGGGGRGGRGGQGITGSPVSAREENKTVQTLGDGTQIESSEVTQFYRDNQGRTRTERTVDGKTTVQIVDPVAAVRITLDPEARTALKIAAPGLAAGRGVTTARAGQPAFADVVLVPRKTTSGPQTKREDLGLQMQNGVMAEGTRMTRTIPSGSIGNNRDIHVVNEQWYSKDLQMMVKTVNSDPRFGVTTYEMTNISQAAPDGSLFMIPAGYAITEQAGRGGRGMLMPTQTTGGGR